MRSWNMTAKVLVWLVLLAASLGAARAGERWPGESLDTCADKVVPPEENTLIIEQRYKELGGKILVIHKPGSDHHPHGLDNPQPIVDYVLEHAL